MRTRFCAAALLIAIVGLGTAWPDNINAGGQVGIVRCLSARTLGFTGLNAGAALKYDRDWHYVSGPDGSAQVEQNGTDISRESPHLFSGDVFVTYGIASVWDFGLSLPLYYDITGWDVDRAGIGDLELSTKLAVPFTRDSSLLTQALYCRLILPTGNDDRGYFPRNEYQVEQRSDPDQHPFTADAVLFNPQLAWTLDFSALHPKATVRVHGTLGAVVTSVKHQSVITGAAGLEYSPIPLLTIFGEVSGQARVSTYAESFSIRHFENHPLLVTPGARLTLPMGLYVTVAGDIGLSSQEDAYRTEWDINGYEYATSPVPTYGVQLTVGWNGVFKEPDTDKDGLLDSKDNCPQQPEDFDGFEDDDGCPDTDNDKDGIVDLKDECPDEAATCDGCPVRDKDGDGINDDVDKCPSRPEDVDGVEDDDGCPDMDNDKDGILDVGDRCPSTPEDQDGFEDEDGCPDMDNDRDGIADEWDKCPNVKGAADNDGCPKTREIKRGALVLEGVNFQSGKAVLTPNSFRILDQVVESLKEWTEVRLEIQGHTDSQGSDAVNMRLSQRRANAVRDYLLRQGVSPDRVTATGYGESNPIADNSTAAGRARNRRVEMHRTD